MTAHRTVRQRLAATRHRVALARGRADLARRIAGAGPGERDELSVLQRRA